MCLLFPALIGVSQFQQVDLRMYFLTYYNLNCDTSAIFLVVSHVNEATYGCRVQCLLGYLHFKYTSDG